MTSFGWGLRQCLGQTLTQDELVAACGGPIWAFNLKRKINPKANEGVEVPLDKFDSLLIIKPDPFEMTFEPRSVARKAEVAEQWRVAKAEYSAKRAAFLKAAEGREVLL